LCAIEFMNWDLFSYTWWYISEAWCTVGRMLSDTISDSCRSQCDLN